MSDVTKMNQARRLLRIAASVDTYRGPGDRRIFIVSPVGVYLDRMHTYAARRFLAGDRRIESHGAALVVFAQNADEATELLTALSDTTRGDLG